MNIKTISVLTVFVVLSTLCLCKQVDQVQAIGVTHDISDTDNFNIRIDGAVASDQLGYNAAGNKSTNESFYIRSKPTTLVTQEITVSQSEPEVLGAFSIEQAQAKPPLPAPTEVAPVYLEVVEKKNGFWGQNAANRFWFATVAIGVFKYFLNYLVSLWPWLNRIIECYFGNFPVSRLSTPVILGK